MNRNQMMLNEMNITLLKQERFSHKYKRSPERGGQGRLLLRLRENLMEE